MRSRGVTPPRGGQAQIGNTISTKTKKMKTPKPERAVLITRQERDQEWKLESVPSTG